MFVLTLFMFNMPMGTITDLVNKAEFMLLGF